MRATAAALFLLAGLMTTADLSAQSSSSSNENSGVGKIFEKAPAQAPAEQSGTSTQAEPSTQPQQAPSSNLLNLLTTQKGIQFSLSYDAFAGYAAGWVAYPNLNDLAAGFATSPVFGLSSLLAFDARPDPTFRIHGSLSWDFPAYATPYDYTTIPTPEVWEMFADYTFANSIFFRIGKQVINWGASRFFPIDDFPDLVPLQFTPYANEGFDNSPGIGVKMGVPIGIDNLTAVAQLKNGYIANPASPHFGEVGYGLKDSLQLGKTELSVAGYYQKYLAPRAVAAFKRTILGVDTRAEVIVAGTSSGGVSTSYLANVFWQQSKVNFNVEAEYMYNAGSGQAYINDSEPGFPSGQAVAVLAGFRNLFGSPVDVGVKWEQSILDGSGLVIPGVSYHPFAHVTFTVAAPFYYGPPNGEMMLVNPDPLKREMSIGFKVDLSGNQ